MYTVSIDKISARGRDPQRSKMAKEERKEEKYLSSRAPNECRMEVYAGSPAPSARGSLFHVVRKTEEKSPWQTQSSGEFVTL